MRRRPIRDIPTGHLRSPPATGFPGDRDTGIVASAQPVEHVIRNDGGVIRRDTGGTLTSNIVNFVRDSDNKLVRRSYWMDMGVIERL